MRERFIPARSGHGSNAAAASATEPMLLSELLFGRIRRGYGVDLESYRPDVLQLQLSLRMRVLGIARREEYLELAAQDDREFGRLLDSLVIGSTSFFRDPLAFDALDDHVSVLLRESLAEEVRVWVAGCSTGEEAYSVAIVFLENLRRTGDPRRLRVYATDLRERAVQVARCGVYGSQAVCSISAARLASYFHFEGAGEYRIRREVRDTVIFGQHDLLSDAPFAKLDLVSCRNVFLYFGERAQATVLRRFHFGLHERGLLFLGPTESTAAASRLFRVRDRASRLYEKLPCGPALASIPGGGHGV